MLERAVSTRNKENCPEKTGSGLRPLALNGHGLVFFELNLFVSSLVSLLIICFFFYYHPTSQLYLSYLSTKQSSNICLLYYNWNPIIFSQVLHLFRNLSSSIRFIGYIISTYLIFIMFDILYFFLGYFYLLIKPFPCPYYINYIIFTYLFFVTIWITIFLKLAFYTF